MKLLRPKTSTSEDLVEVLEKDPLVQIALTSHRPSRGNDCLNFDRRPALLDIFRCKAQEMVVRKAVQVGVSEYLFVRTFYSAGVLGLGVLYMVPTLELRNRIVKARVNPALQKSEYYRRIQRNTVQSGAVSSKAADGSEVKMFGKAPIYFVGSNSPSGVVEAAVDVVLVDEVDKCDPERVSMAFDRYASSLLKLSVKVGNPSFPDRGISAAFATSNQQHFLIRCESCNRWQELNWFKHVVRQVDTHKYEVRDQSWQPRSGRDPDLPCVKCEKPVDRFYRGRWVAKYPDRTVAGFTMNQISSPTTTIEWLLMNQDRGFFSALADEYKLQLFYNSALGWPYAPTGTSLSPDILRKCEADYGLQAGSRRPTTMGVDVGANKLHVTISDHPERDGIRYRRLLWAGTVREFAELTPLMDHFRVAMAVIDIDPETRSAREFQSKHFGRVWLASVTDPSTRSAVEAFKFDDEKSIVTVHRTQMLDAFVAQHLKGEALLPKFSDKIDGGKWEKEMKASKRILDETAKPPRYRWDADKQPDHFFFSGAYDFTAQLILDRGHSSSLAAHPEFSMYAADPDVQDEVSDFEEMMDFIQPERAKKKVEAGGPGDDGWEL